MQEIRISNCSFTSSTWPGMLAANHRLRVLYLQGVKLTAAVHGLATRAGALHELGVRRCELTDGACVVFANVLRNTTTALRVLNLSENTITAGGLTVVLGVVPTLTDLNISGNALGPAGGKVVAAYLVRSRLATLNMNNTSLGNDGLAFLARGIAASTTLKVLRIAENAIDHRVRLH